jgi:hypothetical protein
MAMSLGLGSVEVDAAVVATSCPDVTSLASSAMFLFISETFSITATHISVMNPLER